MDAAIVSGLAGVLGAAVGVSGNLIVSYGQQKLADRADERENTAKKFATYNRVLNINGNEPILEPGQGRGWNVDLYLKLLRPVLFENYHLLDEQVRERVKNIDTEIQKRRWGILSEEEDLNAIEYMLYFHLIEEIEHCYPES